MKGTVLVTGGAGYIGSHACVELIEAGYSVVIVDNLNNSKHESVNRVTEITGKPIDFYPYDAREKQDLTEVFQHHSIDAVIHFAGLKAVGESAKIPAYYYDNNLNSTLILLEVMKEQNVNKLVFSSSATVYGEPSTVPISEDFPLSATNAYGRTKLFIEEILRDMANADKLNQVDSPLKIALLRYFNPVGAHKSGRIGEDPNGIPNNLMPYISQVAVGKLDKLSIFGNDYPTRDGTGVRDYIHVVDLAKGHVKAVDYLLHMDESKSECHAYNLGTGHGVSVLEMVNTFMQVTGQTIEYRFAERRPGDVAECYANPTKANNILKWHAEKNLEDMMRDTWRWQKNNPKGYED